jgi:gas vesicle protein
VNSPARGSSARANDDASARQAAGWQQLSVFGAGIAIGIAVGAGVALVTAPRTGAETRAVLRSRAGRLRRATGRRSHDAWDDLRDELQKATRALHRRKLRRLARKELDRELRSDGLTV